MAYRCSWSKEETLGLFDEEIEPILKEVRTQMRIDRLFLKQIAFEIANMALDYKGKERSRKLSDIKKELRELERESSVDKGLGWLKGMSAQ